MEKIRLKPTIKELVYKSDSTGNLFFDAISYDQPGNENTKLGSISLLGSIKSKNQKDDSSYIVGLIASLVKREYYSDLAIKKLSPREAFEKSLKKINEVIKDLITKDAELDLGVFALAGESVYISKLGKFKIILARDNECIDVLNDISRFNKELTNEKEFSNIISGQLKSGDKIFAYLPFKSIYTRERLIKKIFLDQSQHEFEAKLAHLSDNVPTFHCCGIHAVIDRIKEIPVEIPELNSEAVFLKNASQKLNPPPTDEEGAVDSTEEDSNKQKGVVEDVEDKKDKDIEEDIEDEIGPDIEEKLPARTKDNRNRPMTIPSNQETPRIMSSEISLARKTNTISNTVNLISKFKGFNRYNNQRKISALAIIAGVVVLVAFSFVFFGLKDSPLGSDNQVVQEAEEDFKLAQFQITQNNLRGARELLNKSLGKIVDLDNKKAEALKAQLIQSFNEIDKASNVEPSLVTDLNNLNSSENSGFNKVAAYGELIVASTRNGQLVILDNNRTEIGRLNLNLNPNYLFSNGESLVIFDGINKITVVDKKLASSNHSLGNDSSAVGATLYTENLYTVAPEGIVRYPDAAKGISKGSVWAGNLEDKLISLAADGNIYGLTDGGKLNQYFKGEKEKSFDLNITPSNDVRLWTNADNSNFYILWPSEQKVMVYDKETGQLKATHRFNTVGNVTDIFITESGDILALSADNKVWRLKP